MTDTTAIEINQIKQIIENLKKEWDQKFASICNQANISAENFQTHFENSLIDALEKFNAFNTQKIQTTSDDGKVLYETSISGIESINNVFPVNQPKLDDIYWTRHNALVDKQLDTRKTLLTTIIQTIGSAIGGIINPASTNA